MKDLDSNNILIEAQHRFASERTCEAQLFLHTNELAKAMTIRLR